MLIRIVFLLLLLTPSLCFGNQQIINMMGMYSAASVCTEGSPVDRCTTSDGQDSMTVDRAVGMEYDPVADHSDWGIAVRVNVASGSGTIEVRVGTSPDLSSGYLASGTATVTSTNTANYEDVQWSAQVDFVTTSTYYIGIMETSGDVRIQRNTTDVCAAQSGRADPDTGWNMTATNAYDRNWKSIPCN